jgi:hypothetical protein
MIFGLAAQVLTFAFATPLYCFLHLTISPTVKTPTPENIRIPRAVLKALPLIFIIGYLLPTQLLILPLSENVTVDLKQIFIAIWQPWPAYISILLAITNTLFSPFISESPKNRRASLSSLRWVYAFAFANTAITHLVSWIVSLGTIVAPGIYDTAYREALHPGRVFEVPVPWARPVSSVDSVGEGVHYFLRWDYIIGSVGVLVWAGALHIAAHKGVYGWFWLVLKGVLLSLVVGPVGAAVVFMWERDELVFENGRFGRGVVEGGEKCS